MIVQVEKCISQAACLWRLASWALRAGLGDLGWLQVWVYGGGGARPLLDPLPLRRRSVDSCRVRWTVRCGLFFFSALAEGEGKGGWLPPGMRLL